MTASVSNPEVFRQLFQCISRFTNKVHFDVEQEGIRVRSIDPHDFCYVDLFLKKSFFENYLPPNKGIKFGIDISKLSKVLPKIYNAKSLDINIADGISLEILAKSKLTTAIRIRFLEEDPFDLPEPKRFIYQSFVEISVNDFSNLVETASAISTEMRMNLRILDGEEDGLESKFFVSAEFSDYSYIGEPLQVIQIENENGHDISASIITNYVKVLEPLIKHCETVKIGLSEDKPVRLDLRYQDKGVFSFILSNKKRKEGLVSEKRKNGTSLPRLTVTKLPEYLTYLSNSPEGEEMRFLEAAGLETLGGDYTRMANQLGFTDRRQGRIRLTKEGEMFVNLFQSDLKQAKGFLHKLAISKYASYQAMINCLKEKPLAPDELFEQISSVTKIDRQDLSTLLGLAMWCEVVDRKLALYYFGKGSE